MIYAGVGVVLVGILLLAEGSQVVSNTKSTVEVTIRYASETSNVTDDWNGLFVRGQGFEEIDWDNSISCKQINDTTWRVMLTYDDDSSDEPQLKVLIDDKTWEMGSNTILKSYAISSITIYPWFENTEGTVTYLSQSVQSEKLNNTRPVVLYLPPSYTENMLSQYRNILIMQDGNNLFHGLQCDTCCPLGCWGVGDTLDKTINTGITDEILVVGVFNTPQRLSEYTYSQDTSVSSDPPLADTYLDFLESVIIPLLRQKIRIADNAMFGLFGSSLGGLLSCYGGFTRPKMWHIAGCMSSSFWWNSEDFNRDILKNGTTSSQNNETIFYLDSGTGIPPESDDDEFETLRVQSSLLSLGKKKNETLFYYLDNGGQHSELSWGRRFWIPMYLLFPGSSDPKY